MRVIIILLIGLMLPSCTVTKRYFGSGYHVEWKKNFGKEKTPESNHDKITLSEENTLALEPIVDYTKQEAKKLQSIKVYADNTALDTLKIIVNTIRPGSIDTSSTFDDLLQNKEYKVVYDFSKKN